MALVNYFTVVHTALNVKLKAKYTHICYVQCSFLPFFS